MNIVGIDLSLTGTGIATAEGTSTVKTKCAGMDRLNEIRLSVFACCVNADLVVLEGYSYGSRHSHAHALGELGGLIRWTLWHVGTRYVDVAPALLKKFATGKGNASKDEVLLAAARAGFLGNDNNAADAWWLRQIGLMGRGRGATVAHTQYRLEVIGKIDWPDFLDDAVAGVQCPDGKVMCCMCFERFDVEDLAIDPEDGKRWECVSNATPKRESR